MKIYKQILNLVIKFINKYIICINEYETDIEELRLQEFNGFKLQKLDEVYLEKIKNYYLKEVDKVKVNLLYNRLKERVDQIYVVIDNYQRMCGIFNISYKNTLVKEINKVINVGENGIYLFDDYTFIDYRGKGVQKFSIVARCMIAKKDSYQKASVLIDKNNNISRKNYEGLGFKCISKYYFINIAYLRNLVLKIKVNKT